MTTIALLRHGQTDLNVQRRWQGSTDAPLNVIGRSQAKAAGDRLRAAGVWTRVVTSPLQRAHETATIAAAVLGLVAPESHPGLVEQHGGAAEAMLMYDVTARWPEEDDIPDVETRDQVARRGADALTELVLRHPGERLVVVAHGTFIAVTAVLLTGEAPPHLSNGYFVELAYDHATTIWSLAVAPEPS